VKQLTDNIEEFETAGPFDTARISVALIHQYHGRYQEPTRMLSRDTCSTASREQGASMVEYALLIVLIALIAFVAVRVAGENVSSAFSTVADGFSTN
jgi:Flp pilus assembly pilin Flp